MKVVFFAQTKELVGVDSLNVEEHYATVSELRDALCRRGEQWHKALSAPNLVVAINHEIMTFDASLSSNDDVAFFPPVTGG
ncbi:molybdopterin synthase sulfur carrier subunit [Vibrio sp.]|nr:molybdopterin synthase sulfur carrier subunit [Vibrio sp.]